MKLSEFGFSTTDHRRATMSRFKRTIQLGDAHHLKRQIASEWTKENDKQKLEQHLEMAAMSAAQLGKLSCLKVLLRHFTDHTLEGKDWKKTYNHIQDLMLLEASKHGKVKCMEVLLDHGVNADVNKTDWDKNTALMYAAKNGHIDCINLLLDKGADVNILNINYQCALDHAAEGGNLSAAKLLVQHGSNINKPRGPCYKTSYKTALMHAAEKGNVMMIKYLIKRGAFVNVQDKNHKSALVYATLKDNVDCMETLLRNRANPNILFNESMTPLIYASVNGHIEGTRLLIKHGASINYTDRQQWSPVMYALDMDNSSCFKLLLQGGSSPNKIYPPYNRCSLLMRAAQKGCYDQMQQLIDHGASVYHQDKKGTTVLYYAAKQAIMSWKTKPLVTALQNGAVTAKHKGRCEFCETIHTFCYSTETLHHLMIMMCCFNCKGEIIKDSLKHPFADTDTKGSETFHSVIDTSISLQHQARMAIRHAVAANGYQRQYNNRTKTKKNYKGKTKGIGNVPKHGERFQSKISTLPLPDQLKDYISFKELDSVKSPEE